MRLTDVRATTFAVSLSALMFGLLLPLDAASGPRRTEHRIASSKGIEVFVVRVAAEKRPARGAVVLTHGAGSPSSAVWDLPKGHSVQGALAVAGFDTYAVDVRGFGGSTAVPALEGSSEGAPAVRAAEVMPDIEAAVRFATATSKLETVDLVGWSWGCVVAGMYASTHPDLVRRLALLAPVYDRKWPSRHKTEGVWREEARALHMKWLDPKQEDPEVRAAYVERLFRFVEGDVLRLPNGPYRDVYGPDAPVWDASSVRAPTLVVRGTEDRASLRAPALRLLAAVDAPQVRYVELPGAGHFAFRTRNSPKLQAVLTRFLSD